MLDLRNVDHSFSELNMSHRWVKKPQKHSHLKKMKFIFLRNSSNWFKHYQSRTQLTWYLTTKLHISAFFAALESQGEEEEWILWIWTELTPDNEDMIIMNNTMS